MNTYFIPRNPTAFFARRSFGGTSVLHAEHAAAQLDGARGKVVGESSAPPRRSSNATSATPAASSSSSSGKTTTTHAERAEAIRRNEGILRWLRRLVVPAFFLWGLFVLRPTEGHFLRYVAERRHLDADFNAWFPPVTTAGAGGVTDAASEDSTTSNTRSSNSGRLGNDDVLAAFRTPQDRDWAAQKFHYKKGSEDEERVARRRLLFARERAYLPDDTVVETIRSQEAQMAELRAQREHPPMHLLSEQLDAVAEESRRYSVSATATQEAVPQVFLQFQDRRFFATASIEFRDRSGNVGRTMRFVGACGMLWRQLS